MQNISCVRLKTFSMKQYQVLEPLRHFISTPQNAMKGKRHTHTHARSHAREHAHEREREHAHELVVKTFLPFRVEINELGHIVTYTGFQYNTVVIRQPMKEVQGGRK